MMQIWLLCTDSEINLEDRVLSEVEKKSFIALPSKGEHTGLMFSKLCVPHLEGVSEESYSVQGGGPDWLLDILLIGWW